MRITRRLVAAAAVAALSIGASSVPAHAGVDSGWGGKVSVANTVKTSTSTFMSSVSR